MLEVIGSSDSVDLDGPSDSGVMHAEISATLATTIACRGCIPSALRLYEQTRIPDARSGALGRAGWEWDRRLSRVISSIDRVRQAAQAGGVEIEVVSFAEATKTAAQAAAALGCDVARIVKSLVFVVDASAVLVLMPGDARLDTDKLAVHVSARTIERAPLDLVRKATGFVAGGTPPIGHVSDIPIYADNGLKRHATVWAAAGTPHSVFEISVADLDRLATPLWAELSEA